MELRRYNVRFLVAIIAPTVMGCSFGSKYTLVDPPPSDQWVVTELPRQKVKDTDTSGESVVAASPLPSPAVAAAAPVPEAVVPQGATKPVAAVAPMAVLGEVSETQRGIIFNSLLDKLGEYFDLISQDEFFAAQEEAFFALEDEECTEERCARAIQDILQVENLLILQVIREGEDTQLSVTLYQLDRRVTKSDYCEACGTRQLNQRILSLVDDLMARL